ncbi:MAG: hypothetical protein ABEJ80_09505 [Halarchaeum sp.]
MARNDVADAAAEAEDLPDPESLVDRESEVDIDEIFSDEFVAANTNFETFDELVAASPSDASSADELERVGSGAWDDFVAAETDFADEKEFVFAARDHWVSERLDL